MRESEILEDFLIQIRKPETEIYMIGKTPGQTAVVIKNDGFHHIEQMCKALLPVKEDENGY